MNSKKNSAENSSNVQQAGRDQHFTGISFEQHQASLKEAVKEREELLRREFSESRRADKAEHREAISRLESELAELRRRLSEPERDYAAYQKRIGELEQLLKQASGAVSEERIYEAREALNRGNLTIADKIFAEVALYEEEQEQKSRQRRAEAEYGRGVIADQELRLNDAADHYGQAADLSQDFEKIQRAQFAYFVIADFERSLAYSDKLILATKDLGSREEAIALTEHAKTLLTISQFGDLATGEKNLQEAEKMLIRAKNILQRKMKISKESINPYLVTITNLSHVKFKRAFRSDDRFGSDAKTAEKLIKEAI
ncbi:hypothetical protein ACMA5I_06760 [Paracoccaceae bacterium GXU_MW_L88]